MALFRKQPPEYLLLQMIQTTGLQNLEDMSWFLRESIHMKQFEQCVIELSPYYTPSKDVYTNRPLTPSLAILLLRQVLHQHSRTLKTKALNGVTWYSISNTKQIESSLSVGFD